jgi:hypothetical protein
MDFHKLKIDLFETYNGINLPQEFSPPLALSDTPQVYFMFVSTIQEVMQALNIVQNKQTNKDNRIFFVFRKGNKGFGRDHIYSVVMKHPNIKRKAPVLASLDNIYSVFSFLIEV